jgi:glycosyltransferase involved in cell wall biosynthesis
MDVLLDLTPLDTTSRLRGIGHYAASLGSAMAQLSLSERHNLDIQALTGFSQPGAVGPLTWPGSPEIPYGEGDSMRWIWARRLRLVPTLRRIRPRLLHLTQNLGTPRGCGVPRVLTCHDLIRLVMHEQYLRGSRAYLEAFRMAEVLRFARARRVIAISQYTADDLMRVLTIPASRIDVVHHGVDMEHFRPARDAAEEAAWADKRAALGLRHPYFVYIGAADPRKHVDKLILAFVAARLEGVDLVIAGHISANDRKVIDAVWASQGRPASVRFVGFVPDDAMSALLSGSLALAYPSSYEGFGMPVLEGMACGAPVITTAATSLGEVAGDAALLVAPGNTEALTSALTRIAREPSLRRDLREAGLARARRFTWRATALGTVDSYARALRQP